MGGSREQGYRGPSAVPPTPGSRYHRGPPAPDRPGSKMALAASLLGWGPGRGSNARGQEARRPPARPPPASPAFSILPDISGLRRRPRPLLIRPRPGRCGATGRRARRSPGPWLAAPHTRAGMAGSARPRPVRSPTALQPAQGLPLRRSTSRAAAAPGPRAAGRSAAPPPARRPGPRGHGATCRKPAAPPAPQRPLLARSRAKPGEGRRAPCRPGVPHHSPAWTPPLFSQRSNLLTGTPNSGLLHALSSKMQNPLLTQTFPSQVMD